MPSASALAALQAGINPDASAARAATKGREGQDLSVSFADMRRLLLIEAAETGDISVLKGRRLELLGRAESVLDRMARVNEVSPAEMRRMFRDMPPINEELYALVADGKVDPAEALQKPHQTLEAVRLDQEDAAIEELEASGEVPDAVLAKLDEVLALFGSDKDRGPALQVLQQAMGLSQAGRYAISSALLNAE